MGRRTGIFSVEYFPPRSVEGEKKLLDVHNELSTLEPEFFSVTYGAGGSTRVGTLNTVMNLKATGSAVAPHLSFGNSDEAE
jgi:methylenetetrahydrofolate reductase (NADPH)